MSERKALRDLLNGYEPFDSADSLTHKRFLRFITEEPRCFERSLLQGHITGSSWLVDREEKQVLLTHHRKLDKWMQLGGHADGDTNILAVALREAQEESGLSDIAVMSPNIFDLDIHLIPARKDVPEHFHYDVRFLLRASGDCQYRVSHESHDLRWISMDEIENYSMEASLLRMKEKWKQHIARRNTA